jgi:hypothetical protein
MGVGRRLWGQGLLGRWRRTKSKNVFIVAFFIFLGGVFVRIAEIEIGFRCGVNITARGCWTSRMRGRWPSGHLERRESEWGEGKESVCDRADQQWPIEHNFRHAIIRSRPSSSSLIFTPTDLTSRLGLRASDRFAIPIPSFNVAVIALTSTHCSPAHTQ